MSLLTSLIAHWKLNEASGTRNDAHGANHLTDNNTVTQVAGVIGNAAQFTAANSEYLSIADNSDLSTGNIDFTFACWVKLDAKAAAQQGIAGKGSASFSTAGNYEWFLRYAGTATDLFQFQISNSAAVAAVNASAFGSPTAGTWYFIVVWHDAAADTISIQVNNGTVDSASVSTGAWDSTQPFLLGFAQASTRFLNGALDSASFWKRVLTTQEKTDLYNSGNGSDYPFGTIYADSVSESVTTADSQTASASFVSARSESLTASESQTGSAAFASSTSDSLSASDAQTSAAIFVGSTSEALTASDSATSTATFSASQSESVTLSDQIIGGLLFTGSVTETISISEISDGAVTEPSLQNYYAFVNSSRTYALTPSSRSTARTI